MCERCLKPSLSPTRRDRRKLWEIPPSYHCAIVGTCFGPDDMAWLCRKLHLTLARTTSTGISSSRPEPPARRPS